MRSCVGEVHSNLYLAGWPINNAGEYVSLGTRYVFLRGQHCDPSSISINVNDDEPARGRAMRFTGKVR